MMKSLLTICSLLLVMNLFAYTPEAGKKDSINHPEHHKNEIAITISPVYLINEKLLTYAVHLHYTRTISTTDFGYGLCVERVFGSRAHSTAGVVAAWMPGERFNFSLSPSLSFDDADPKAKFDLHFDASYEFEVGAFHIGPEFEFAFHPGDMHTSLGLHLGYGF